MNVINNHIALLYLLLVIVYVRKRWRTLWQEVTIGYIYIFHMHAFPYI